MGSLFEVGSNFVGDDSEGVDLASLGGCNCNAGMTGDVIVSCLYGRGKVLCVGDREAEGSGVIVSDGVGRCWNWFS